MLDRYEELIAVTRMAGQAREAFKLYRNAIGTFSHVGGRLGEYERGYRILRGFLPESGERQDFAPGLETRERSQALRDLIMMAWSLGRLKETAQLLRHDSVLKQFLNDPALTCNHLQDLCGLYLDLGLLHQALAAANEAISLAVTARNDAHRLSSLARRATTRHRLGDIVGARADFHAAVALETKAPVLRTLHGRNNARHRLDLGDVPASRLIAESNLQYSQEQGLNFDVAGWHALCARIALAEAKDPDLHIREVRAWTARSSDMELIIEAHLLAGRAALGRGDLGDARDEAIDGLRQAGRWGYRVLEIELLTTLSAIHLAWPNANEALAAARRALDLATAPECGHAWAEADAAHAWGLSLVARERLQDAQRAFEQALKVRERIQHPKVQETREALGQVGGLGGGSIVD